jgi:hypothetical protein
MDVLQSLEELTLTLTHDIHCIPRVTAMKRAQQETKLELKRRFLIGKAARPGPSMGPD